MSKAQSNPTEDLRTVIDPAVQRWINRDTNEYEPPLPDAEQITGGELTLRMETDCGRLRVEEEPMDVLDVYSDDGRVGIGADTLGDRTHGLGWYMDAEQARALAEGLLFAAELADQGRGGDVF